MQPGRAGGVRRAASIVRVALGALLALPLHALRFDGERLTCSAARLVAAIAAPVRLNARHCIE